MLRRHHRTLLSLLLAPLLTCCGEEKRAPPLTINPDDLICAGGGLTIDVADEQEPEIECPEGERQLLCYGSWAAHCDASGDLVDVRNCRVDGQLCAAHKCDDADDCTGCRDCIPGSTRCGEDGARFECRQDGSGFEMVEVCDEAAGERCSLRSGLCEDLCAAAEAEQSYIGCEYWAVATSNAQLAFAEVDGDGLCQPFTFAVVVANPQGIDAHVRIERGDGVEETHTIAPGQTETIALPCSPELKGGPLDSVTLEPEDLLDMLNLLYTLRVPDAAHHITSDVPVTVYQFNPLEFEADWPGTEEHVFSHTNDASLLLPVHTLTGNYRVMSVPTLLNQIDPPASATGAEPVQFTSPGFVAFIGVEDDPVEVEITSSAWTMPSEDDEFPMLEPGETFSFSLAKGEVVQLRAQTPADCVGEPSDSLGRGARITYCAVPRTYDLTGTLVRASGKVSVIAGHDCAFLPYDRWACDHIEETMFPIESWGRDIVVGMSETAECQQDIPNAVRVLSHTDENRINFVPEVHEPVVLDAGEYVEFETTQDVRVSASDAVMVGQFLLGQDYHGFDSSGSFGRGDPALSLGIPFEQWRNQYAFLAPETFSETYLNITAAEGQLVVLDGRAIRGFNPIEGTRLQVARVRIEGGHHNIESGENFGIVVYGYAPYTSFMVPGGLDLNRINRPD